MTVWRISKEVEQKTQLLARSAEELIPSTKTKMKPKFRDDTLSHLCAQSRAAQGA